MGKMSGVNHGTSMGDYEWITGGFGISIGLRGLRGGAGKHAHENPNISRTAGRISKQYILPGSSRQVLQTGQNSKEPVEKQKRYGPQSSATLCEHENCNNSRTTRAHIAFSVSFGRSRRVELAPKKIERFGTRLAELRVEHEHGEGDNGVPVNND
ncbi:hypothetical protein EDC04DRAFT_506573 [Pisolithus marmoratus]|nr:hypothetical protein EDC04DRAFT_506573 [Pisolithus marmoratus]